MNRYNIILIFTLLFFGKILFATDPGDPVTGDDRPRNGIITGHVVEAGTVDPMEYSTIAAYNSEDSTLIGGTVTDQDGNFEVKGLSYGSYYVETNFVGYNKKVIDPVLLTPDNWKADLGKLELTVNTQAIDEVEVVADRKHVEYRLDKKIVNVSQDINAAGGTAIDVLQNTPSVNVDIEGNVTLRGSSSFTVLIDGKPSVLTGSDALQQIPASAIENIEIITNPSAKYDPDGNAGIINVVMKRKINSGTTGIVNASIGMNHKYRTDFLVNRKMNKWNVFVGGNYNNNLYAGHLTRQQITHTDSLDRYVNADGKFDFKRTGMQLKGGFSYDFSENSTFSLEAEGGQYSFGMDRSNKSYEFTDPVTNDVYYVSSSLSDRKGKYLSLNANYTKTFGSQDHKLVAMAYFSKRNGNAIESQDDYLTGADYVIKDVIPESTRALEPSDENEYRLQVDYTRPVGNSGKLEMGYQARIDDEFEDYKFQDYDPVQQEWIQNKLYSSTLDFFRNIQGAYVTYGGELNGFQYQLGLRGEYTYRRIDHAISENVYLVNRLDYYPTIHLAREFKNDNQLMLSYSKRVDRPRSWWLDPNISYVDPYTVRVGNPELDPEYVHSVELGYQKGWGMNFLAIELYYRNTRNLLTRVTEYSDSLDLFIYRAQNINNDHSAGAEIMANWKFGKWLTLNGSFTPYYYRIVGELNGVHLDQESINWRTNLNTTFQITPTTRFQVNTAYNSKSVSAQGTTKGFYYMNLALRQDFFKRKLSATLQFRDVFGSMKRDFTNTGDNFTQHVLMVREPRVLTLTLSYKINNYKVDAGDRSGGEGGGMEMDGGF